MKVIQTVQTKVKTRKFPNCKTNQVLTTEKDDFYVQYCCNQCVTFLDLCDAGKSGRTGIFDGLL